MSIKVGDRLPDATFMEMTGNGPEPRTTTDIFAGKTVAFFAVPGAFTPTCSARHLPGFVENSSQTIQSLRCRRAEGEGRRRDRLHGRQ